MKYVNSLEYKQGKDAYTAGIRRASNPYRGNKALAWAAGWDEAWETERQAKNNHPVSIDTGRVKKGGK